jgi:hypothetical protein
VSTATRANTSPKPRSTRDVELRLRPRVHASPTANGIHVRGWADAFTVDGAAGLWPLWQRLAPMLIAGVSARQLDGLRQHAGVGEAVALLTDQLREYDMLIAVPAAWRTGAGAPPAAVADWLEAAAPDPVLAWQRMRAASVTVTGAPPLAAAVERALAAAGLSARLRKEPSSASNAVLVSAGGMAVAAACDGSVGFVAAPTPPGEVVRDAARIADRIGLAAAGEPDEERWTGERSGGGPGGARSVVALVGGAAAYRLVCSVAGLPDPAIEAAGLAEHGSGRRPADWPAVLVARAEPLNASYRPWLLGGAPGVPRRYATLDEAMDALDALCDDELGVLSVPEFGDLPQLPAALAACSTADGTAIGTGATTSAARLDAALRSAARRLTPGDPARIAVGIHREHADGVLLRRSAALLALRQAGPVPDNATWLREPVARRWWKALTLRFGVQAAATVEELADGVFLARLRTAERLSWAVEATPGDAAAFAALSATAAVQARLAGRPSDDGPPTMCGAAPPAAVPYEAPWLTDRWIWPQTHRAEARLQEALRRIVPAGQHPEALPNAGAESRDLADALATAGFVAARTPR